MADHFYVAVLSKATFSASRRSFSAKLPFTQSNHYPPAGDTHTPKTEAGKPYVIHQAFSVVATISFIRRQRLSFPTSRRSSSSATQTAEGRLQRHVLSAEWLPTAKCITMSCHQENNTTQFHFSTICIP
ncbi:transducin family protein / WD-40 repeat family protein [Striga asiatica]|uniref:Transducin family protein / WD-40 repeat family protein n=1 Tax=Striga asiatica TaxID=4170 RepID=A0A5A7R4E0_STRAF|nr:transducin family protein / WD-40 repeat family protein [Striga asiatica]